MTDDDLKKVIVVAGGTGGIGRHVVDGILAVGKYTVKVFSRQEPATLTDLTAKGVTVIQVNYFDYTALVRELQGVHTVIVTLISIDDSCIQSQVNLLNAAVEAKVQRFAPSEWAGQHDENTVIDLYRNLKLPVREKVKASGIEYSIFMPGLFMDYFAAPQRASASLYPFVPRVDINKCEANIIGTGDEPFCVTRADDVGRFVAAALDLDKWDESSGMIGSRTTWNELVKLGEKIRGKKFDVKYTPVDDAWDHANSVTDDVMAKFTDHFYIAFTRGEFDVAATLNRKCPEVKPMAIEEFLYAWWGDKKGQVL